MKFPKFSLSLPPSLSLSLPVHLSLSQAISPCPSLCLSLRALSLPLYPSLTEIVLFIGTVSECGVALLTMELYGTCLSEETEHERTVKPQNKNKSPPVYMYVYTNTRSPQKILKRHSPTWGRGSASCQLEVLSPQLRPWRPDFPV